MGATVCSPTSNMQVQLQCLKENTEIIFLTGFLIPAWTLDWTAQSSPESRY